LLFILTAYLSHLKIPHNATDPIQNTSKNLHPGLFPVPQI